MKKILMCLLCLMLCGCSFENIPQSIEEDPVPTYPVHETETSAFYYDQLNEDQQGIYAVLMEARDSFAAHVDFPSPVKETDFNIAYTAFINDNPEVYWGTSYSWTGYSNTGIVTSIDYKETGDYASVSQQISDAADAVVASVPEGSDTYGTVKYFYEWIIQNTAYGESDNDQDVRSVFLDHVSVCSGYAKAFKLLCDKAGIPCTYVRGKAHDESHAWNLVNIDGIYTWVDATWGDPVFLDDTEGTMNYNYLCVPDDILMRTHTADTGAGSDQDYIPDVFAYPACSDWSLEYYVRNGFYFTSYDRMSVYSFFAKRLSAGTADISFQFADETSYQEAVSDLFAGEDPYIRTLAMLYADRVTIKYTKDDTLYVIQVSFA